MFSFGFQSFLFLHICIKLGERSRRSRSRDRRKRRERSTEKDNHGSFSYNPVTEAVKKDGSFRFDSPPREHDKEKEQASSLAAVIGLGAAATAAGPGISQSLAIPQLQVLFKSQNASLNKIPQSNKNVF